VASEKPRYRRLLRAVPSFETKEVLPFYRYNELPPIVVSEIAYETETKTVVQTQTVTVPPPANTRLAANPKPEGVTSPSTPSSPKTTAVEVVVDEDDADRVTKTVVRKPRATRRPPSRWFGGW